MKSATLLGLVSILSAGAQTTNPHATPADRVSGSKIFRSHCASCHGVRGTGGLGPDLTSGTYFHGSSDAELFRNQVRDLIELVEIGIDSASGLRLFSPRNVARRRLLPLRTSLLDVW